MGFSCSLSMGISHQSGPSFHPFMHRFLEMLQHLYGLQYDVTSSHGVILAAGGFGQNPKSVKKFIPSFSGAFPIGAMGDDGCGMQRVKNVVVHWLK